MRLLERLRRLLGDLFSSRPPVPPAPPAPPGEVLTRLLDLHNEARSREGVPALKLSSILQAIAGTQASKMQARGALSHQDGSLSPFDRMRTAGYRYSAAGENIAQGSSTPEATMQQWLSSPPHRLNLLNPTFTEAGFGVDGVTGTWWCADFGQPLS